MFCDNSKDIIQQERWIYESNTPYPKYAEWFHLFVGMMPALVLSVILGPHKALGAGIAPIDFAAK